MHNMADKEASISPAQIRAARALLGWSQADLAQRVNIARRTLAYFESGERHPHKSTVRGIREVFEAEGIAFLTTDRIMGVTIRTT